MEQQDDKYPPETERDDKISFTEKINKYLRIVAAGALLTGIGTWQYHKQEKKEKQKESEEYVETIGLRQKAESAGFGTIVSVPNGDGPYILQIGWKHSYTAEIEATRLMNEMYSDEILKNNREVEQLLLSLKGKSDENPVVFSEGYDENSIKQLMQIAELRDKIQALPINEKGAKEARNLLEDETSFAQSSFVLKTCIEYMVNKKIKAISGNMESFEETEEKMIRCGGQLKAFIDGGFVLAPADSAEAIARMKKFNHETLKPMVEKLGELAEKANKGDAQASKRYDELSTQYNSLANKNLEDVVRNEREDHALAIVTEAIKENNIEQGLLPLVYGVSHDFTDNIERSNASAKGVKVGLITLVPYDFKGIRQ